MCFVDEFSVRWTTLLLILIKRSTLIGHLDMQGRLAGAFDFLENTINVTVREESIITCATQVMIGDDLVKESVLNLGSVVHWVFYHKDDRKMELVR